MNRHFASLLCASVALVAGCSSASHGTKAVSRPAAYPTIVVTKGSAIAATGCNTNCFHLHVAVTGVTTGRYSYECANVTGSFYAGDLEVKGPLSEFDAPCYTQAGFEMPVSFQLHKVPAGGTTATIRSANAIW